MHRNPSLLLLLLLACSLNACTASRQLSRASTTDRGSMKEDPSPPWFCHDLDCPPYTVESTIDNDIELRSYPAGSWVSTNVSGMGYDRAIGVGFMRLFNYISGANQESRKVDMTAPVRNAVVPGQGPFCEDHFKISFYVPQELQANPPVPTSEDVFIDPAPEQRFFVISYPGFSSESKMLKQAQDLINRLDQAGLSQDYDASAFFSAGYDSPFRLLNRHNEVWIPAVASS